jgi:hypothetical protein
VVGQPDWVNVVVAMWKGPVHRKRNSGENFAVQLQEDYVAKCLLVLDRLRALCFARGLNEQRRRARR